MKRFFLIALMLALTLMYSCAPPQKTAKETTSESVVRQTFTEVQKESVAHSYVSNVIQSVIDTLKEVTLPVERSYSRAPQVQRSDLETSLAESSAWVDSSGLLNHQIHNKKSAQLTQRNTKDDRTTIRADSIQMLQRLIASKDSLLKSIENIKPIPPEKPKDRLLEGFFYKSGVFAWFALLVVVLWYLQVKTKVKPFSWVYSLFKKLIFKR